MRAACHLQGLLACLRASPPAAARRTHLLSPAPHPLTQGLTTCLYPLSVIKTRQMALEGSERGLRVRRCMRTELHTAGDSCWRLSPVSTLTSGLQGAYLTARSVVAHDGIRGLYKGFGTVVFGMFPARMASRAAAAAAAVSPLQLPSLLCLLQNTRARACHPAQTTLPPSPCPLLLPPQIY